MKIFSIAVLSVLVLAAGGAFVLTSIQETAAQAETTGSARFNQDENVNFYGREAPEYLRQVRDARLHDRTCGVTAIRKSRPVGRLFRPVLPSLSVRARGAGSARESEFPTAKAE